MPLRTLPLSSHNHHHIHLTSTRRLGAQVVSAGPIRIMNVNHQTDQTMLFSSIQLPGEVETGKKVSSSSRRRRRKQAARGEGDLQGKKRRLSVEQVMFLEKSFWSEKKLECRRKVRLASEAGLDPKQVVVWFQNRRARWKSKKLEEEYMKLKSLHNTTAVEKIHLQAEVINLRDQLSSALKEMENLHCILNGSCCGGGGGGGGGVNGGGGEFSLSPTTAYSMDAQQSLINGEVEQVGMDGFVLDVFDLMSLYEI